MKKEKKVKQKKNKGYCANYQRGTCPAKNNSGTDTCCDCYLFIAG